MRRRDVRAVARAIRERVQTIVRRLLEGVMPE